MFSANGGHSPAAEICVRNSPERVAWFNGKMMPEREVRVPFRDRSFKFGDAVFDLARTFGGMPFRLVEHVERLYRSLSYVQIDPGISPKRMLEITHDVLDANLHLLDERTDYWVGQRISRGIDHVEGEPPEHEGPNVIVECTPIPFISRAPGFRDGFNVIVPSVRRTPPDCLSPKAKTHNYLNLVMGDLEARARDPRAWAVLLDVNGNLCEGLGSNIFLVRDGVLMTPRTDFVLPGVTRDTVISLAHAEGIPVAERDISLYDAYSADEIFLTSTSLCVCPVRAINGVTPAAHAIPGPMTKRLMDAFSKLVDFDYVAQYLAYLEETDAAEEEHT